MGNTNSNTNKVHHIFDQYAFMTSLSYTAGNAVVGEWRGNLDFIIFKLNILSNSQGMSSSAYVTKSQLRVLKEKRQKIRHQPDNNAISKKDKVDDTEKPVAPTRNRRMSTVRYIRYFNWCV